MNALRHMLTTLRRCAEGGEQLRYLEEFFRNTAGSDLLWAAFLLRGGRLRRQCTQARMKEWAVHASGIPDWLVEDSLAASGDVAETLSLLPVQQAEPRDYSLSQLRDILDHIRSLSPQQKGEEIARVWMEVDAKGRELLIRLLLGKAISSIREEIVHQALSVRLGVPEEIVALWYVSTRESESVGEDEFLQWAHSQKFRTYPFRPMENMPENTPGDRASWFVERVTGTERAQFIKRNGKVLLWSERRCWLPVPDGAWGAGLSDDTVIECGYSPGGPLCAYALLEYHGVDVQKASCEEQRSMIEDLRRSAGLQRSRVIRGNEWNDLREIRTTMQGTHDWMLLRNSHGATRWIRWKAEPWSIQCVLLSVRRDESGEMTLGVWEGDTLVPCARVRPEIPDEDIRRIATFVSENTVERFGPVLKVLPSLVFALQFDAVHTSRRHRSGLQLLNPRICRWERKTFPRDAGTLDQLRILAAPGVKPYRTSDEATPSLFPNL